jgi:hypothetical protein
MPQARLILSFLVILSASVSVSVRCPQLSVIRGSAQITVGAGDRATFTMRRTCFQ